MIRVHYAGITVSAIDDSERRGDAGWGQGGCSRDDGRFAGWIASLCDGVVSTAERRGIVPTVAGESFRDFGEKVCGRTLPVSGLDEGSVGVLLPEWNKVCRTGCHFDSGRGGGIFTGLGNGVEGMSQGGEGEHLENKCLPNQSVLDCDGLSTFSSFRGKEEVLSHEGKVGSGIGLNSKDNQFQVKSQVDKPLERSFPETKTERNRRWRKEKKALKEKRQAMNQDWRKRSGSSSFSSFVNNSVSEEDVLLQSSLKAKWRVQNELAVERARRELEVLKASDIEQEKKRYRTRISAATERNMVSIEQTHAKLRQTGNLPNEQGGGFAETIVSGVPGLDGGSGTISPDSSASMAEFRACQKALLDAEKALLEERNKLQIVKDRFGIPVDFLDTIDKETWTIGDHNEAALDAWYPNGYGINTMCSPEGKFHAIKV